MTDRSEKLKILQRAREDLMEDISRLQKQVETLEGAAQRAAEFDQELASRIFVTDIDPSFGVLTMSGTGEVKEINFRRRPDVSEYQELGEHVLAAFRLGREKIVEERSMERARIFRNIIELQREEP